MKSILKNRSFIFSCWFSLVLLAMTLLAIPASLRADETSNYLPAEKPDAIALLAAPPLPGSPEQDADLAEVQAVYHSANSNDMAAAYSERKFSIFNFRPVIGDYFLSNNLPKTTAFFERVQKQAETVTDEAKNFYRRPRPYTIDTNLANGKLERSFSYPSGHSTESMVLALVLVDLFPDKHDAIIARARSIGWHRVEIARHYLTDIYAGRVLAQAIVREMKTSADFQKDFGEAKVEIAALQKNRL